MEDASITAAILGLLSHRDVAASACPSEVARTLGDERQWRTLMPQIREVLVELIKQRRIIATRGSRELQPEELSGGPIRIRRGRKF
jgi:hypothetical protein